MHALRGRTERTGGVGRVGNGTAHRGPPADDAMDRGYGVTMMRKGAVIAAVIAGLLLLVVAVGGLLSGGGGSVGNPQAPPPAIAQDDLGRLIERAQQRLENNPQDYRTWAELGSAYVEQARITADPSYYPRAEGALQESLDLNDSANDVALTGMGALSNARHEFAVAADWARQALVINPSGATTYGVLADALTQLGDYDEASAAIQQMLDLRPGIPAFTRASYDLELHGNIDGARSALEQALAAAFTPSDVAFCRTYLGHLSFSEGDLDGAAEQYAAGLLATPGEPSLLIGQARVAAARGEQDSALDGYGEVVAIRPLPEYLVEFGDYLESLGRTDEADVQFALFETTQQLFEGAGVQDQLTVAYVEADHGDPGAAVEAAEQEWAQRENVDSADALAWALHSAGRDAEALPYAQQATGIGGRNALFLYHRGIIEAALGMAEPARETLDTALGINEYFSPLHAPMAKEALAALGGPL